MANLDAARWSGAVRSNRGGTGECAVRACGRRRFLAYVFGAGRAPTAFETLVEPIALPARDQARVVVGCAAMRARGGVVVRQAHAAWRDGVIDQQASVDARCTHGCEQARYRLRCNRDECDLRGHRRSPDERKRQRPPGQVSSDGNCSACVETREPKIRR